jgi:hypothetical protein
VPFFYSARAVRLTPCCVANRCESGGAGQACCPAFCRALLVRNSFDWWRVDSRVFTRRERPGTRAGRGFRADGRARLCAALRLHRDGLLSSSYDQAHGPIKCVRAQAWPLRANAFRMQQRWRAAHAKDREFAYGELSWRGRCAASLRGSSSRSTDEHECAAGGRASHSPTWTNDWSM